MAILKETVGITFVAGILAAGVTTYMAQKPAGPGALVRPSVAHAPSPVPRPATGGGGSAPVVVAPPSPVPEPVAIVKVEPPPPSLPVAAPADASLPVLASLPAEVRAEAVDRTLAGGRLADAAPGPVAALGTLQPPDPRWTPTPQPELMAKAEASFDDGDVAGARLWLEAALEKGDADAAFRLAETYDPAFLAKWRVVGMASDPERARALYERAMNGGVEQARQRMAALDR